MLDRPAKDVHNVPWISYSDTWDPEWQDGSTAGRTGLGVTFIYSVIKPTILTTYISSVGFTHGEQRMHYTPHYGAYFSLLAAYRRVAFNRGSMATVHNRRFTVSNQGCQCLVIPTCRYIVPATYDMMYCRT